MRYRYVEALLGALDDPALEPVGPALRMGRDHDLVGAERTDRVLDRLDKSSRRPRAAAVIPAARIAPAGPFARLRRMALACTILVRPSVGGVLAGVTTTPRSCVRGVSPPGLGSRRTVCSRSRAAFSSAGAGRGRLLGASLSPRVEPPAHEATVSARTPDTPGVDERGDRSARSSRSCPEEMERCRPVRNGFFMPLVYLPVVVVLALRAGALLGLGLELLQRLLRHRDSRVGLREPDVAL